MPTLTRRYSDVIDEIERLLRLPETPVADLLLAELVMGSPYKLITPGVARALGLAFPQRICETGFFNAGALTERIQPTFIPIEQTLLR